MLNLTCPLACGLTGGPFDSFMGLKLPVDEGICVWRGDTLPFSHKHLKTKSIQRQLKTKHPRRDASASKKPREVHRPIDRHLTCAKCWIGCLEVERGRFGTWTLSQRVFCGKKVIHGFLTIASTLPSCGWGSSGGLDISKEIDGEIEAINEAETPVISLRLAFPGCRGKNSYKHMHLHTAAVRQAVAVFEWHCQFSAWSLRQVKRALRPNASTCSGSSRFLLVICGHYLFLRAFGGQKNPGVRLQCSWICGCPIKTWTGAAWNWLDVLASWFGTLQRIWAGFGWTNKITKI